MVMILVLTVGLFLSLSHAAPSLLSPMYMKHNTHKYMHALIDAHPSSPFGRRWGYHTQAEAGGPDWKRCHSPPPCEPLVPPNWTCELVRTFQAFPHLGLFLACAVALSSSPWLLPPWTACYSPSSHHPCHSSSEAGAQGLSPATKLWVPLLIPCLPLMDSHGGPSWHCHIFTCQVETDREGGRLLSSFPLNTESSKLTGLWLAEVILVS